MRRVSLLSLALVPVLWIAACGGGGDGAGTRFAFITIGVDPFWDLARKGAEDKASELGLELDFYAPPNATIDEQRRKVEDLLALGVDGIAISPIDASNMIDIIDEACEETHLVTQDSDAPGTQRRCFIGCDNYAAGRACGALVKEALPEGGEVMLFIGRLEQDNAKKRRQGVIDELLGRDHDPSRYDGNNAPISGAGYTVVDTRTDDFRKDRAKANAEDALAAHPDLDAMVGLFAYNPPAILEATRAAGRDDIAIIGFDEARSTVQAILDGQIHGTVSQQPWQYGAESVRVLDGLLRGDETVLPESGNLTVEHKVFRKDNAQDLLDMIDEVLGN